MARSMGAGGMNRGAGGWSWGSEFQGFRVSGFLLRAQGSERRAQSAEEEIYIKVFLKLVIFLLNNISLELNDILSDASIIFLLSKMCRMFAHSKTERLDIFKKLANSFSDKDPDPSAILFDILIAAALNCSANLKYLFSSAFSAKSKRISEISIDSFQISNFSNLKSSITYRNFKS